MGVSLNSYGIVTVPIDVNTAATHLIVPAPSSSKNRCRIYGLFLKASGDVSVQIVDGTPTVLSGDIDLTGSKGFVLPLFFNPHAVEAAWFEGARTQAINLVLDAAVQVSGIVIYRNFDA